jgi:dihydroorotase-like cyclic amidohydrolase
MVNWGGIASVQFGLSILYTSGVVDRQLPWSQVVRWLCEAPAKLLNLANTKGKIQYVSCRAAACDVVGVDLRRHVCACRVGFDADLVVFDPTSEWKVTKDKMLFKNKVSAYEVRLPLLLGLFGVATDAFLLWWQGYTLKGNVEQTILRGEVIVQNGQFVNSKPTGVFC